MRRQLTDTNARCAQPRMILGTAFLLLVGLVGVSPPQSRGNYRQQRLRMVEKYLVREGITDRRVLAAMRSVPRHEFVRSKFRRQAYLDRALAIGYRQTISPPFIVAYMTETIQPQPEDRVLEIGTGSGYQAAVLSKLVRDVFTIEIVEALGKSAERRLKRLDYENVHTRVGDGYKGWPGQAPFDKIIVTCSPENVPAPLVQQLREGGKMIIPLGERYQQVFHLFEKRDGKLVESKLIPTLFVPMTGISEQKRQIQPDPLHPEIVNGGFELDENEDDRADNWHYQRQTTLLEDDAPEGEKYLRFENAEPGRSAQLLQGMPLDGRHVGQIEITVRIRVEEIRPGPQPYAKPALAVHFYDNVRRSIGEAVIGPWVRNSDWQQAFLAIPVPAKTREAIVRIGLHGATGRLDIDDVRLVPRPR